MYKRQGQHRSIVDAIAHEGQLAVGAVQQALHLRHLIRMQMCIRDSAIGVRQTRTEALFYFALAFAHSISAVMRGAGRAKMPMYTMLVCWCVIRVTYITLALKVWPDIITIFWAYPITWCLSCVVFLLYYLKADWVHSFQKAH